MSAEGYVPPPADLTCNRPFGNLRARSDALPSGALRGSRRQMCSVLDLRVETAASSLCSIYGGDQVMFLPLGQRNRVEGQVSSGGWLGLVCRGRPGYLLTSPGKPLGLWSMHWVGAVLVAWFFSWAWLSGSVITVKY